MEAIIAWLHILSILTLTGFIAAEFFICSEHLQPGHVRLLTRLDLGYLAAAVAVLATGLARLLWFSKEPAFYLPNPVFWIKMALFAAIGLVSIPPTLQFLRWNRALNAGQMRVLKGADIVRIRRLIGIELALLAAVPLMAILMARGIGG
ncbi:MAG: DUF2214 family protein [Burkholderiales bacterium]|nr:DUF2214 family protein [Burkholderiales bacterium]